MIFNSSLRRLFTAICVIILCLICSLPLFAQNSRTVKGVVIDADGKPIQGSTVQVKQTAILTSSDANGRFSLLVPTNKNILIVTFLGKAPQEINIRNQNSVTVSLKDSASEMSSVIVVGYGKQKKASLVGSIVQTTSKDLQRTGGVSNLGSALTGKLPGLVTMSSSGQPGGEDPQLLIRAATSWNNSAPLILVDGVERPGALSTIDIGSVESISMLKDASATAVFGVKGANGVILITTKKGSAGKPTINIRTNMTVKTASKLPKKYDAYDALSLRNQVIERELMGNAINWGIYVPQDILNKYRNPANAEEWDRYPNVDWYKELFKNSTNSYNASINVSGGSQFVTYFTAVDFVSEGDLFKTINTGRGYTPGFGYNRTNMRSNLDFNLTKSTKLTTRLFGSRAVRKTPWNLADNDGWFWKSAYSVSPEAFRPVYSDGTWGYYPGRTYDIPNSLYSLATSGVEKRTSTQLTTDFVLEQRLDMIIKGLSARGSLSMDNSFREVGRGINDPVGPQRKWIDPLTGAVTYEQVNNAQTQLDYADQINWVNQAGSVDTASTYRHINYMAQLNYARKFGKHDVSGLALFQREKTAKGNMFPIYREDWVFRATYGYDYRFLFEANGAYNGSEKFGPDYRFAFFPSLSVGWNIGNEKFVRNHLSFINNLKLRASWGKVGDDQVADRFLYSDQWVYNGNAPMGSPIANSPYTFYRISSLGNPNISWETVDKRNVGVDFDFLNGAITGSVDVFRDVRSNIIILGSQRAIPSYFGVSAPSANLGKASGKGYEFELKLSQTIKGWHLWASANVTHAENHVIDRDDPQLLPDYQKQAGWQLNQTRAYVNSGYLQSWDDIYGSTQRNTNNQNKLAGDYNILDYNGDGVIDNADRIPYGYSSTPQNTYNLNVGFDWKGLSAYVQFYGVNNVTREVTFPTFQTPTNVNVAYVEGTYWTKANGGGDIPLPRYAVTGPFGGEGTRYLYDGSYMRLKNAEVSYTLNGRNLNKLGVKTCRIYVNGNNLRLWTKMPDDREANFGTGSSAGAYPTMKRYNLGLDINL